MARKQKQGWVNSHQGRTDETVYKTIPTGWPQTLLLGPGYQLEGTSEETINLLLSDREWADENIVELDPFRTTLPTVTHSFTELGWEPWILLGVKKHYGIRMRYPISKSKNNFWNSMEWNHLCSLSPDSVLFCFHRATQIGLQLHFLMHCQPETRQVVAWSCLLASGVILLLEHAGTKGFASDLFSLCSPYR